MARAERWLTCVALLLVAGSVALPWWTVTGHTRLTDTAVTDPVPYPHEDYVMPDGEEVNWVGPWITLFAMAAATLLLVVHALRVGDTGRRRIGGTLLVLLTLSTLLIAWLLAAVEGEPRLAVLLAVIAFLPVVALGAWRVRQPRVAWGSLALYGLPGAFFPEDLGILAWGIIPFALANLAWRWPAAGPRDVGAAAMLLVVACLSCFFWPDAGAPPFNGSHTTTEDTGSGVDLEVTRIGNPGPGWAMAWAAALVAVLAFAIGRGTKDSAQPRSSPPSSTPLCPWSSASATTSS